MTYVHRVWCSTTQYHSRDHEAQAACTRIVVLGDTHGQLGDVLWAISKFGMPNERNVYVVNGDIASWPKHAANYVGTA